MPLPASPAEYCAHRFFWAHGATWCRYCGGEPRLELLHLSVTQRPFRNQVERECVLAFIYQRDGAACSYCDLPLCPDTATVDHVEAWSKTATNSLENFVLCCARCNHVKGEYTADWLLGRDDHHRRVEAVAAWRRGERGTSSTAKAAAHASAWLAQCEVLFAARRARLVEAGG